MKALELVKELEAQATFVPSGPAGVMWRSADEIRNLVSLNSELLEALEMCLRACEIDAFNVLLAMQKGNRAIAKAKEQQ